MGPCVLYRKDATAATSSSAFLSHEPPYSFSEGLSDIAGGPTDTAEAPTITAEGHVVLSDGPTDVAERLTEASWRPLDQGLSVCFLGLEGRSDK